jgi:hypothetical protein
MSSRSSIIAVMVLASVLVGCKSNDRPPEGKPKDPYAGMTKEQKIEALRNDPTLMTMERESRIAELQKSP